ncbi:hypothetical protein [uncultured Limosilactobacillus sp.]|uniref:hypothetical protein n=1 Tax=uncultured Limosilactobacillus sp. TaxID=2837629 RepID=UPI0025F19B05|nr:hypothetical protein [uncultured Limosilactobacillus sp.]
MTPLIDVDPLANAEPSRKLALWATLAMNNIAISFRRSWGIDGGKAEVVDQNGLLHYLELPKRAEYLKSQTRFYSIADLCINIARQKVFDNVAKRNNEQIIRMLDKMKPDYQQHQRQNMQKFVRSL